MHIAVKSDETVSILSDVEPPATAQSDKFDRDSAATTNKDAVAVIIGNKDYAGAVPDVDFAHNDANAMKRFVVEVLGFREGNIIDLRDATMGQLTAVFGTGDNAEGQLHDWVKDGKSDVVVFYSGHGAPGLRDKRGYLVPVDADPRRIELTGYPVDLLYANLAQVPARRMTVYLDACFSGETPKGMIIEAASAIIVQPKLPAAASGLTVLTAASRDQVANWDTEAKHGLFTRYLLQALRGDADADPFGDGDGEVTLAEVGRYLDEEMTYQSKRLFGAAREQRATAIGDNTVVLASLPSEPPQPPPEVFTTTEADLLLVALRNANVRAGPSTKDAKVGALVAGDPVYVTGEVEGRDWYRVALADGGEGYVWLPLLGEVKAAPAEPEEATQEPETVPPLPTDPSEIVIASGPLRGLMLADWLLLSADRLQSKEYVALIEEAVELRQQHGRIVKVEAVLQKAVMGDLAARKGMARVVYAAAYRRQHGSFGALETFLDNAVGAEISSLQLFTKDDAHAALNALSKLEAVSGTTPVTLSLAARAYHLLDDYSEAEAVYGPWLNTASPDDEMRKTMIASMLRARKHEPLGPQVGDTFRDCGNCPEMIIVPAGEFLMGSPEYEDRRYGNESPAHRVSVHQPFAIGKHEVTFDEWDACATGSGSNGYRPGDKGWGRGSRPVINVSYEDATAYTAWLSGETGHTYRLPSEAEWEYAARAGTQTHYHVGNSISSIQANYDWDKTVPVGNFPSNGFGLHDVIGNVWEWVEDCWNGSYADAPSDTNVWMAGNCSGRILRGGSWNDYPWDVRTAIRNWRNIKYRNYHVGFRVARTLP